MQDYMEDLLESSNIETELYDSEEFIDECVEV